MQLKGLGKAKKIYFIGIGGISMSALAQFLSDCGYIVAGSDAVRGEQMRKLLLCGINIYDGVNGMRGELIDADAVVYTDAIPETNEELMAARLLHKLIYTRAELLGLICETFPNVIAVAGSHGKTTCTSMCAHILKGLRLPFTAHIGGEDGALGNYYASGQEYFVTEACEYKKNLLRIRKDVAVLLNIDKDHMECYEGEADLRDSFYQYCASAKAAFVCGDDKNCREMPEFSRFGIEDTLADYRAIDLRAVEERYSFTVEEYGKALCRIHLNAIGRCNVYNALAAFAAIRSYGFPAPSIARGLETFTAVKRRFEKIGEYHGATFICDYAHHPKEIASTIKTASGLTRKNLHVIFQPHTYSRTKLLLKEFVETLRPIKSLMLYKTYPAREKYEEEGCAKHLSQVIGNCLYADNIYVLKTWLKRTIREGDVVLFLGAGDIYFIAQYLLKELS